MKVSTKGRYALRIMVDLALNDENRFISLKEIADKEGISLKYLEQIISLLNKAGFLETSRGNTGGYKLIKRPEEYVVGDILRATEGDLTPIFCISEEGGCDRQNACQTYEFWKGLDDTVNAYIDSKTLKDLIK